MTNSEESYNRCREILQDWKERLDPEEYKKVVQEVFESAIKMKTDRTMELLELEFLWEK